MFIYACVCLYTLVYVYMLILYHNTYIYIYTNNDYDTTGKHPREASQGSITILCLYPWSHLDNTTLDFCHLKTIGHRI